jgi:predicted RNA methylase
MINNILLNSSLILSMHAHVCSQKLIITANTSPLSGRDLPLKESLEVILENPDSEIQHILVYKRTDKDVPMKVGRDEWLEEVCHYNIAIIMEAERCTCNTICEESTICCRVLILPLSASIDSYNYKRHYLIIGNGRAAHRV